MSIGLSYRSETLYINLRVKLKESLREQNVNFNELRNEIRME